MLTVEPNPRGSIAHPAAYDAAKRLDHSSWQTGERLPRLITPSDIDVTIFPIQGSFVCDNNGKVIFVELTRAFANWDNVSRGQRWLYRSCIQDSVHCAVICKHSVTPEMNRPIDTRLDIESFQIMLHDSEFITTKQFNGNDNWQRFVRLWCADPLYVRRFLLGRHVGMVKAQ